MTYGFYAPNVVDMPTCACCGCEFERDPADDETVSCGMCQEESSVDCDHTNTTCGACERH